MLEAGGTTLARYMLCSLTMDFLTDMLDLGNSLTVAILLWCFFGTEQSHGENNFIM